MLDDMLKLTLDVIFPIPSQQVGVSTNMLANSLFHVDGYEDNVNMWEHIYNLLH